MNCPKCGAELPDNATVCTKCGEKLVKVEENAQTSQVNQASNGAVSEEQTGFSITGFILSIASVIFIFINGLVSILCSILAIIFGAIGRKKGAKGLGTAGMVIGIIVTVLLVILFIFVVVFAASIFGSAFNSTINSLNILN